MCFGGHDNILHRIMLYFIFHLDPLFYLFISSGGVVLNKSLPLIIDDSLLKYCTFSAEMIGNHSGKQGLDPLTGLLRRFAKELQPLY